MSTATVLDQLQEQRARKTEAYACSHCDASGRQASGDKCVHCGGSGGVKRLIRNLANFFHNKHGGDLEEWISEAHVGFTKAYNSYNPTRTGFANRPAKFSSWCQTIIFYHLQDYLRRTVILKGPLVRDHKQDQDTAVDNVPNRNGFSITNLLRELSEDGQAIMEATLKQDGGKRQIREKVVDFFWEMGWAAERILESFKEIQEILT